MNQTEAWETVLVAANDHSRRTKKIAIDGESRDLSKALQKVGPKVAAMRVRLDVIRARKAAEKKTAAGMPPWLEKATR